MALRHRKRRKNSSENGRIRIYSNQKPKPAETYTGGPIQCECGRMLKDITEVRIDKVGDPISGSPWICQTCGYSKPKRRKN